VDLKELTIKLRNAKNIKNEFASYHNCRLFYQIYYFFHHLTKKASYKKICAFQQKIDLNLFLGGKKHQKFAILSNLRLCEITSSWKN